MLLFLSMDTVHTVRPCGARGCCLHVISLRLRELKLEGQYFSAGSASKPGLFSKVCTFYCNSDDQFYDLTIDKLANTLITAQLAEDDEKLCHTVMYDCRDRLQYLLHTRIAHLMLLLLQGQ